MTSLRTARAERLLSIRDLARAADVAPSTIYLIESGRSVPRPSVVRRIAAALEVQPAEIEEFRRAIRQIKEPPHRGRTERPSEN
jgi:transcriptional regulator with XRE-family HTH domain